MASYTASQIELGFSKKSNEWLMGDVFYDENDHELSQFTKMREKPRHSWRGWIARTPQAFSLVTRTFFSAANRSAVNPIKD